MDDTYEQIMEQVKSLPDEEQLKFINELSKRLKQKKHEDAVVVDMFCGNEMCKKVNELMHVVDMFESGKQLVTYEQYTITGKPDLQKLCRNVKDAWEKMGGYVVFVGISYINGERVSGYPAYIKEGVQSLSISQNGDLGWLLFKKALEHIGYEVETDQRMHVLNVK